MAGRLIRFLGDVPAANIRDDQLPPGVRADIEARRSQASSEQPRAQAADDDLATTPDIEGLPATPSRYRRLPLLEDFVMHIYGAHQGWRGVPPMWGVSGRTDANGAIIQGAVARGQSGHPHILLDLAAPLVGGCPIYRTGIAVHECEHVTAAHIDRVAPDSPLHQFSYEFDREAAERRADDAGAAAIVQIAGLYNRKRDPKAPVLNPAGCEKCFRERGDISGRCRQPNALPAVQAKLRF